MQRESDYIQRWVKLFKIFSTIFLYFSKFIKEQQALSRYNFMAMSLRFIPEVEFVLDLPVEFQMISQRVKVEKLFDQTDELSRLLTEG